MIAALLALALAHPGGHERITEVERQLLQGDCPAQGLLERGRIWFQMDHHADALADFTEARRCDPELIGVDREEARVWLALARPELARVLLELHLERAPEDGGARALLAEAHADLGEWAQADAAWDRAMTGDARWTPDLVLAWAEARELATGPADALALVDRGLEKMPGAPALEDRAIQLEIHLGRTDAALARIDARIQAWPTHLAAWLVRGDILAAAGRSAEARAAWTEVPGRYDGLPGRLQNARTQRVVDQARERLAR